MGFKSLLATQVKNAMNILGTDSDGLAIPQTYISTDAGGSVYNTATREVVPSETRHAGVPMALVRFKIDDMDAEVKPQTDRRALIASLDLPVTPTEQDRVELDDGTTWTVMRLLSDPSSALYIVHLRRE